MTPEDKLTRSERRRLESLAQSIASRQGRPVNTQEIIDRAKAFDEYIQEDEIKDGGTP